MERLRGRADAERRRLNQQATHLLERALGGPRPSFSEARQALARSHGSTPFNDDAFEATFAGLRSQEPSQPSPFGSSDLGDRTPAGA